MTAKELCELHRVISASSEDLDAKDDFRSALRDYLKSPERSFYNLYRLKTKVPVLDQQEYGTVSKSFIGELIPELKSLNMSGYAVRDLDAEYDYLILEVPLPWGSVKVWLRLHPSMCCVTGDFPQPDKLNKWLLLEAKDIKFLSSYIPEQLRLGVVYDLAIDHGWDDCALHDTQVLLTSDK